MQNWERVENTVQGFVANFAAETHKFASLLKAINYTQVPTALLSDKNLLLRGGM
jgi:hypothetical protein